MLKRHIIVEGMDNTGKTTLLKALSERFRVEPTNSCRSIPKGEQIRWMKNELAGPAKLFDRFPLISESIYGPIVRGTQFFPMIGGDSFFHTMEKVVIPANPIIIFCNPGIEKVAESFGERWQMGGVKENMTALMDAYGVVGNIFSRMTPLTVMVYDYNKHTPELISCILEYYMEADSK